MVAADSKPKHTPGPWHIEPQGHDARGYWIEERPGSADFVAMSCLQDDLQAEIANARLIAASPDLLAALENVRGLVTEAALEGFQWQEGDWVERLFASQRQTSAAIRLALTGERS